MSVDWCQLDPRFLLSCGKDNRTLLWNPDTHECLGEYGAAQNWTFKTKLNERTPDLFATASFEGKIVIQTLQDVNGGDAPAQEGDFFQNLGTQSQAKISLKQAPSWLQRPVSNSFGFGGKIVTVTTTDGKSTVQVGKFVGDKVDTESIEVVLKGDLTSAFDEVKGAEWKVLEALSKGTDEVRSFLDIPVMKEEPAVEDDSEDVFSKMSPSGAFSLESSDPINQAIINGNLSTAVDLCLKEDRLLDAFALAEKASDAVKTKVQNAYFAKQTSSTARLLNAVNTNKLDDVVENANLKDWKEILALLYTYGGAQFGDLAAALGDRLRESDRDNAATCYLVSGKLDKVSGLWESEITTREKELTKDNVAPYTAHFSALKEFIEKISVFRKATNAVDSGTVDGLYNKYREFANIVASQGNLELAQQFLALLPASFEGVGLERERLNKAAKPSVATTATSKASAYGKPSYGSATPQASAYTPTASAYGSMYAPAVPAAAAPAAAAPHPLLLLCLLPLPRTCTLPSLLLLSLVSLLQLSLLELPSKTHTTPTTPLLRLMLMLLRVTPTVLLPSRTPTEGLLPAEVLFEPQLLVTTLLATMICLQVLSLPLRSQLLARVLSRLPMLPHPCCSLSSPCWWSPTSLCESSHLSRCA